MDKPSIRDSKLKSPIHSYANGRHELLLRQCPVLCFCKSNAYIISFHLTRCSCSFIPTNSSSESRFFRSLKVIRNSRSKLLSFSLIIMPQRELIKALGFSCCSSSYQWLCCCCRWCHCCMLVIVVAFWVNWRRGALFTLCPITIKSDDDESLKPNLIYFNPHSCVGYMPRTTARPTCWRTVSAPPRGRQVMLHHLLQMLLSLWESPWSRTWEKVEQCE